MAADGGGIMVRTTLTLALLSAAALRGQITRAGVVGLPTSAQAVLSYVAPDENPCTIEVSESPAYSPLAHDFNPALYAGAGSDGSRPGSMVNGRYRTIVAGKRVADIALDGKRYSRALQAFTTHYYRVSCGAVQTTGSFRTGNVNLGSTYDDVPFDRSRPGDYAWPTVDYADRDKKYIDTQTGILMKRMTDARDIAPSQDALSISDTFTLGAGWTGLTANYTGQPATFSGGGQAKAFFRIADPAPLGRFGVPTSLQALFQASASGSGPDALISLCFSKDGVNCASKVITQALGGAMASYAIGGAGAGLEFWRSDPSKVPFAGDDIRTLSGALTKTGAIATRNSGNFFSPSWKAGSRIVIGGSECLIASVQHQNQLTLQSPGCAPDAAAAYSGRNFGLLVWKNSAIGSITLAGVSLDLGSTGIALWSTAGVYTMCSPVSVTGPTGPGYFCGAPNTAKPYFGAAATYWIGVDGTAVYTGQTNESGAAGLAFGTCAAQGGLVWDKTAPATLWCIGLNEARTGPVIYKGVYDLSFAAESAASVDSVSSHWTWTLASADTVDNLAAAFDSSFVPGNQFCSSGWRLDDRSKDSIILHCSDTFVQDQPGWVFIYNTVTNQVSGLINTWSGGDGAMNRWGVLHSVFTGGDIGWIQLHTWQGRNPTAYSTSVTAGTLTSSFAPCPADSFEAQVRGTTACSTVTVADLVLRKAPGNTSLAGERIRLGDYLMVFSGGSADDEQVRVQAISGNAITVQRGLRSSSISFGYVKRDHSGNLSLAGASSGWAQFWRNYEDDPHARNIQTSFGSTLMDDPDAFDCHKVYQAGIHVLGCLKSIDPPNYFVNVMRNGKIPDVFLTSGKLSLVAQDPRFAGGTRSVYDIESHSSRGNFVASLYETQNTADMHPYFGDTFLATQSATSKVAGTNFIYKVSASGGGLVAYKYDPLLMTSGSRLIADVSPAVLTDTAADNLKGCFAVKAGDCLAGSVPNEIYLNVPGVTTPYCVSSWLSQTPDLLDICVTRSGFAKHKAVQFVSHRSDPSGSLVRHLGSFLTPFKTQNVFWNSRHIPDGSWLIAGSDRIEEYSAQVMMAKLPPFPPLESQNRGQYASIPVKLWAAPGATQARIRFGYAENGPPESFYCTPRQVSCATASDGDWVWADGTQAPHDCSSGCTINLPATPGRVVYYLVDRLAADGTVMFTSPIQAVAAP